MITDSAVPLVISSSSSVSNRTLGCHLISGLQPFLKFRKSSYYLQTIATPSTQPANPIASRTQAKTSSTQYQIVRTSGAHSISYFSQLFVYPLHCFVPRKKYYRGQLGLQISYILSCTVSDQRHCGLFNNRPCTCMCIVYY